MQCDIKKNIKIVIMIDTKSAKEHIKLLNYFENKDFFKEKGDCSYLKFKFCLPYLFHIENATYEISINSEIAKFTITRKYTDKVEIKKEEECSLTTKANSQEIEKLVNAEIIHDDSGKFWYSEIEVEVPFTKKEIEFYENKKGIPHDAVRTCLLINKLFRFINRFITCYRNSLFEPQIREVSPVDLKLIYLDKGDSYFAINFSEQIPLINYKNSEKSYNIGKTEVDNFLNRLSNGKPIPLWVDLMSNANLYFIKNDFRMCIIECYIVLESYIKEIIEEFLPKKFNDNLFKQFYKEKKERLSLNDLYDQFAELCLDFSFKQSNSPLWDKFIRFKKLRNDAVHNKLVIINEEEANECKKATMEILNLFQQKRYGK